MVQKTTFDKHYADKLYKEYKEHRIDDSDAKRKLKSSLGAVRDVIEKIIKDEGIWSEIVNNAYGAGL